MCPFVGVVCGFSIAGLSGSRASRGEQNTGSRSNVNKIRSQHICSHKMSTSGIVHPRQRQSNRHIAPATPPQHDMARLLADRVSVELYVLCGRPVGLEAMYIMYLSRKTFIKLYFIATCCGTHTRKKGKRHRPPVVRRVWVKQHSSMAVVQAMQITHRNLLHISLWEYL